MSNQKEIEELIYENKESFNNNLKIMFIYYCALYFSLKIDNRVSGGLISIFIVILTFSVVLITLSTKKIYEDKYFTSFLYSNVYVIIISLISFFDVERYIPYINKSYDHSTIQFIYYILLIIPIQYINNNKKERKISNIIVAITIIIYLIIVIIDDKAIFQNVINGSFIVILTVYLWLLRKEKIKDVGSINYFKVSILILYLKSILYNIVFIFNININEWVFIFIFCLAYGILSGGIINKLVNDPYKILFAEVYNENIKLQDINYSIIEKNKQLEKSQEHIKKREKMFQMFLAEIPISIVIVNNINNRIIFANKSFLTLFNYSSIKEVVNKKIDSMIKFNNDHLRGSVDCICSGQSIVKGDVKYLEIQTIPPKENEFERVLLVYDSSIKRNIENVKKKLDKELLEEKIKREFLSNITHDLKTPINVIYSAMQVEKFFLNDNGFNELVKYNNVCKQNCKSLIALTDNLIDSGKVKTNYMEPKLKVLNLIELLEKNIVGLIDYAKIQNIDMIFDTNCEDVFCMLDEEFINRVVTNLISNAIKFTNEGGEIRISVEKNENKVRVVIKDNGIGMDQYFVKVAFERYSMDRNRNDKGSGIGLYVVRKLVELQGGEINITSKVGVGTDVIMYFNVLQECKEIIDAKNI
ncbi:MAG: sensor histidine kinase [Clostridium sp.]